MSYGAQIFFVIAMSAALALATTVTTARLTKATGLRRMVTAGSVLLALIGIYAYWPTAEVPAWEEPATEQERKARDFAHSIVLPDSIPKPSPFNFALARIKALVPGLPSVSEQYFQHLCDTEAGQYIFRTVENVEGFMHMRLRRRYTDIEQMNPYLIEDAVGLFGDTRRQDLLKRNQEGAATHFVQPLHGEYLFVEQPALREGQFDHFYRDLLRIPAARHGDVIVSFDRSQMHSVKVPFMVSHRIVEVPSSRFGYTWRGIRRDGDRYHGIAGGDLIVLDLHSSEVLAVFRNFKQMHGRGITARWELASACESWPQDTDELLIRLVLKPIVGVNRNVEPIR